MADCVTVARPLAAPVGPADPVVIDQPWPAPCTREPGLLMAEPSSNRKMLRQVLGDALRLLGAGLAGLLTYPVIARVLSAEGLGAWSILASLSFVPLLTDLGLTTAVQRCAARGERARTNRAHGFALLSIFTLSPFVVVLLYVFFLELPNASAALQADVGRAAIFTLAAGVLGAYTAPFRGLVIMRGRVNMAANARTAASLTQVVIVGAGLVLPPTLVVPAVAVLLGQLAESLILVATARALDSQTPLLPRWPVSRPEVLEDLRQGSATLVSSAANVAAVRVDTVVLAQVAPLAEVASYGVALRAVDQSYVISSQTTVALIPRLGDPVTRAPTFRLGTLLYSGLVVGGMAALALCGQPLLVAWVGPVASGRVTAMTTMLLGTAAAVVSLQEVATHMLVIAGASAWKGAIPRAAGSVVNLAISVAGASRFGMWAVAGSTICGNLVHAVLALRSARTMLRWSTGALLRMLLPVAGTAAAAVGVGIMLAGFAHRGPLQSLLACTLTTAAGVGVPLTILGRQLRAARRSVGARQSPPIP